MMGEYDVHDYSGETAEVGPSDWNEEYYGEDVGYELHSGDCEEGWNRGGEEGLGYEGRQGYEDEIRHDHDHDLVTNSSCYANYPGYEEGQAYEGEMYEPSDGTQHTYGKCKVDQPEYGSGHAGDEHLSSFHESLDIDSDPYLQHSSGVGPSRRRHSFYPDHSNQYPSHYDDTKPAQQEEALKATPEQNYGEQCCPPQTQYGPYDSSVASSLHPQAKMTVPYVLGSYKPIIPQKNVATKIMGLVIAGVKVGKKGVDAGMKAGKKGVDAGKKAGKKGVDAATPYVRPIALAIKEEVISGILEHPNFERAGPGGSGRAYGIGYGGQGGPRARGTRGGGQSRGQMPMTSYEDMEFVTTQSANMRGMPGQRRVYGHNPLRGAMLRGRGRHMPLNQGGLPMGGQILGGGGGPPMRLQSHSRGPPIDLRTLSGRGGLFIRGQIPNRPRVPPMSDQIHGEGLVRRGSMSTGSASRPVYAPETEYY